MFALWERYAATHHRRLPEFARLLTEASRWWHELDLPPGAAMCEDIWHTVESATVQIARYDCRGTCAYGVGVEFRADWNLQNGDPPNFFWDEASDRFSAPTAW
jgi:hypothetical protein